MKLCDEFDAVRGALPAQVRCLFDIAVSRGLKEGGVGTGSKLYEILCNTYPEYAELMSWACERQIEFNERNRDEK